jgi:hypothetical protein
MDKETRAKLEALLREEEEVEGDLPSLYLPSNVPDNFYYDAEGLKKLSKVDSQVFRKLLGL